MSNSILEFKYKECEMYFCRNKKDMAKILKIDFNGREEEKKIDGMTFIITDIDVILDAYVPPSLTDSDCIDFPSEGKIIPLSLIRCDDLHDGVFHAVIRTTQKRA